MKNAYPIIVCWVSGARITYHFSSRVFQSKGTVFKELFQRNSVQKASSSPEPDLNGGILDIELEPGVIIG